MLNLAGETITEICGVRNVLFQPVKFYFSSYFHCKNSKSKHNCLTCSQNVSLHLYKMLLNSFFIVIAALRKYVIYLGKSVEVLVKTVDA